MNQDLSKLKIRDIDFNFCIINYGDLEVILMKYNNYVNISKICGLDSKEFKHWKENKKSKELLDKVYELLNGFKLDEKIIHPIIYIDSPMEFRGSYIHPYLFNSIINFLSPKFYLKLIPLTYYLLNDRDMELLSQIQINKKEVKSVENIQCTNEKEWSYLLTQFNSNISFQYSINQYKIDAYFEDEEKNTYFLEYDERDHKSYDTIYELNRYKTILKTFVCYSKKINILRFSNSFQYNIENIKSIIEYVNNLSSKYNIIYINYNKHSILKVNEILYSFNICEYKIDIK